MPSHKQIRLFGCDVAALTMDETVEEVRRIVSARRPSQHIVLNAFKIVMMYDDPAMAEIVRNCRLISVDGQSIVLAARFLGKPAPQRVPGIDLMNRLLAEAEGEGWSVFFLGASPQTLDRFLGVVRERHPNLKVAGARDGYFSRDDEASVADMIAESSADVLFVGITSPK